jgi:hypothetical protein
MHIASALHRKRDEIAATIAAYEARIDAARRDLAALDQAARLFDPEAGSDETVSLWDRERLTKPGGLLEAPREAHENLQALATGRPPVERMQDLEHQIPGKVARSSAWTGPGEVPEEFFYLDWP